MFLDGTELDRYFETDGGIIWVSGLVRVRDQKVLIDDLLIYPATCASVVVGVRAMLDIVRSLMDEATAQGLSSYAIEAERMYEDRPRRMISISRRLR